EEAIFGVEFLGRGTPRRDHRRDSQDFTTRRRGLRTRSLRTRHHRKRPRALRGGRQLFPRLQRRAERGGGGRPLRRRLRQRQGQADAACLKNERRRDGGTERRRDGETERRRDKERA